MDILFLAFANSREHPLKTLADEYAQLNKTLSPRVLQQHFLAWAISHATLDDIAYYLVLFRSRLRLFQFSGHAGRDVLLTEEGKSRADGIAHLLAQCPNLQVVILNGCSTQAQVETLQKAGIPLVIATSAPVNDNIATRFSKRLYQALETGLSINEAFEIAIGETIAQQDIKVFRNLGFDFTDEADASAPLWGIFCHPDHPLAKDWKLPRRAARIVNPAFEPNELLLETLYKALGATNPRVKALWDDGVPLEANKEEVLSAILKALPAPISEQIRKLVMPSLPGAAEGWDQVGSMRLSQITQAYQICMDFLVFTLLAQLWEIALIKGLDWGPSPALRKAIDNFLHLNQLERQELDYISLVRLLREAFPEKDPPLFIEEFKELQKAFLDDEKVKDACFFLETLRRQLETAQVLEMAELCERAEIALSDIFSRLGYMGHYILATVRNIDVQKYRHTEKALFEHLVMKWHGSIGIYEKEYRRQPEFMDNRSVILLKAGGGTDGNNFLNLSPFILDENTFEPAPDLSLSKLYFFDHREKERLYYKCVNDPENDVIDLDDPSFYLRKKKASKFQLAKVQFMAFYQTFTQSQNRN